MALMLKEIYIKGKMIYSPFVTLVWWFTGITYATKYCQRFLRKILCSMVKHY